MINMLLFFVKKILPQYNKNYCKDGTYDNSPESVEKLVERKYFQIKECKVMKQYHYDGIL